MEGIGRRIRSLRVLHGMNQEDLAEKLGVSISTVSGWEKDVYEPSLKYVGLLCDLFKISPNNLFGIGKQDPVSLDEKDRFMISVYNEQMPEKVKDAIRDVAFYVHEQYMWKMKVREYKQKVDLFICTCGLQPLWDAFEKECSDKDGEMNPPLYRRYEMKRFLKELLQREFPTEASELVYDEISEVAQAIEKYQKEEEEFLL